jgi:TolB-like protein/class 3 adenylate cyclase
MDEAHVERRLAAIFAADIAGYSRLMVEDEVATVTALRAHQAVVLPLVERHGGRIQDTAGDGILAEFRSVLQAVVCAVEIQRTMAERNAGVPPSRQMRFRIGVNLGDVMYDGVRVYGDGVNIAARLEGVAEPGGVCISEDAFRQIRGKIDIEFVDIGEQSLKNIRPLRVYRALLVPASEQRVNQIAPEAPLVPPPGVTDTAGRRLSIIVLPFVNLSGDPEQEYVVDGITESLTTELSRIAGSFVIARNTAFTFKGKSVNVQQTGRELGVRYVLEGSVQAAGTRVRVNAQLIDADSGAHVWADRFDSQRGDLFDLQDEIVTRLSRTLNIELTAAEADRAERLRAQHPDSTDLSLRGRALLNRGRNPANWKTAVELFQRALSLDADNVEALCGLSNAHSYLGINWVTDQPDEHFRAAEVAALRALALAPNNARAHYALGRVLIGTDRGEEAIGEFERALALDRNMSQVHGILAMCKRFLARPEEAEAHALSAIRLSPRDVGIGGWYFQIGAAALQLGQFDKAVTWLRRSIEADRSAPYPHLFLASALAHQGALVEARAAATAGLAVDPNFRIGRMIEGAPSKKPRFLAQWEVVLHGMREAGLPE